MLRNVGLYLLALWRQWKVLLTGGSIMAVVAIWALFTNRGLPYNLGWLILGLTFIAASFMSWRREYERANAAEMTQNARPTPVPPQEQAKRDRVCANISGASAGELDVLKYLLDHDEIESSQLHRSVADRDTVSRALEKWVRVFIRERVEHGTNITYFSIIPGMRDALTYVLYNSTAP